MNIKPHETNLLLIINHLTNQNMRDIDIVKQVKELVIKECLKKGDIQCYIDNNNVDTTVTYYTGRTVAILSNCKLSYKIYMLTYVKNNTLSKRDILLLQEELKNNVKLFKEFNEIIKGNKNA